MAQRPTSLAELRAFLRADRAIAFCFEDFSIVAVFRLGQYSFASRSIPVRIVYRLLDRVYLRWLIGVELPQSVGCGPGLKLHHAARGLIVHPAAEIGAHADIYHAVTIGVRDDGRPPIIGDRAHIGTGATIMGPITLGDDVQVGAGAVVLHDAGNGTTLVGVPATPVAART